MRTHFLRSALRPAALLAALVLSLAAVRPAHAAPSAPTVADSGMLVIYEGLTPVAHERFAYQVDGDSILVTALAQRQLIDDQKQRHLFEKAMLLVVDSRDLGLRRYQSNQSFRDRTMLRGLLVTDTVFTYYTEDNGAGDATRIAQPPGRLFVLDSALFTLFDVICRSLAGKEFETRKLQLVEMAPDSLLLPMATVTRLPADTLHFGRTGIAARRYVLDDDGVRFDLWADADGRMLRARHEGSGLSVDRVLGDAITSKPAVKPRRPAAAAKKR